MNFNPENARPMWTEHLPVVSEAMDAVILEELSQKPSIILEKKK